ncbi:MAG: C39 family peptidase [Cellulosilyticaceae bacterium]
MKKSLFSLLLILIGGLYGYTKWVNQDIPTNLSITTEKKRESRDEIKREKELETKEFYYVTGDKQSYYFESFDKAYKYANTHQYKEIYFKYNNTLIWKKDKALKEKVLLKVPHYLQYPELARGCEVTSLAMLLNYYGYEVDKMRLAEEIKKDNTPYYKGNDGKIFYGNPYEGFVGDIYDINKKGYGVYHGPVASLARQYAGGKIVDLTGAEFIDVLKLVEQGYPVWVVINGAFKSLEEDAFEIWHTPTGLVKITKRMHAVVITGYDKDYIYINDPLYQKPNRKLNKREFKLAWEQMGNQAIIILE